jgi:outer membrane protein
MKPLTFQTSLLLTALVFGALSVQSASAQEPATPKNDGASQWGLGLAVLGERAPYRDIKYETGVLPLISYENRWVSVLGPTLDLKLPSAGALSFRLRARYGLGEGYEAADSPFLTGMEERKASFWVGGAAMWRTDLANLSAELLGDASGNSKGLRFKLGVDRRFQYGAFDFTPRLAAVWMDQKSVSYYYGVTAAEATAGRPFYEGSSTVDVEAGLRVGYALTPKQTIFLDLSATRLGSSVTDSPLVDRSTLTTVRAGYLYRF